MRRARERARGRMRIRRRVRPDAPECARESIESIRAASSGGEHRGRPRGAGRLGASRERVPGQRRVPPQRRGRRRAIRGALRSAGGDGPRPLGASRSRRGRRLRAGAGAHPGGVPLRARAGRAYPDGVPRVLKERLDGLRVVRPRGRAPSGRRHSRDVRSRARLSTRRGLLALLHRRRRRRVHEGRALAGRGAREPRRGHRVDARARRASGRASSLPSARALRDREPDAKKINGYAQPCVSNAAPRRSEPGCALGARLVSEMSHDEAWRALATAPSGRRRREWARRVRGCARRRFEGGVPGPGGYARGARAGGRPHSSCDFLTVSGRVRPSRHSEIRGAFDRSVESCA